MKKWIGLSLLILMGFQAQAEYSCYRLEPSANGANQADITTIWMEVPSINQRSLEIKALTYDNELFAGTLTCRRSQNGRTTQCLRPDDGGQITLTLQDGVMTLKTTYIMFGDENDGLDLQSPENDPWVYTGSVLETCQRH